jgi:undecaprenyl-diphosphatase
MTLLQAAILGIVQGLTEFIPVSSSGHLILARGLLGLPTADASAFIFDVLVQLGTWLAVLVYFRSNLIQIGSDMLAGLRGQPGPNARLGWLVLLATLPAVVAGWLLQGGAEQFSGLTLTAVFLLVDAALLVAAEWLDRRQRSLQDLRPADALWVGAAQVLALLPAVSRSASTLFGGMSRNLQRRDAARFAFLMAVPIMPAAAVVALLHLGELPNAAALIPPLGFGFVAAAIIGYLSIRWLLAYLATRSFYPFAIYCALLGALILLLQ